MIKADRSGEGEHQLDLFTWLGKQKLSSRPLGRLSCEAHWSELCHMTALAVKQEGNRVFLLSASMVKQSKGRMGLRTGVWELNTQGLLTHCRESSNRLTVQKTKLSSRSTQ